MAEWHVVHLPAPLKKASPALGSPSEDVEHLIQTAVRVQEDRRVQERREVGHLVGGELKRRHPLVRSARAQELAKLLAAFIVLHEDRAGQVRSS